MADTPKQPIEKSIASPSLLAFVATQKYVDALPLYRQSEMFKRIGIELDRTNLAIWMVKSGELIQPLINLLHEHICQQPIVHMDETTVQVLEEPGKTAQSKSFMCCIGHFEDKPAVIFDYDPSRSQSVPERLLTVPPQTALGKALVYLQNQWQHLVKYLDDVHYPIDNNAAERAIRPFTIGRKNWMFSKSQKGAKASANLYSLIETAKANRLNPYEYLMHVFKELLNAKSVDKIESLLPWNTNQV